MKIDLLSKVVAQVVHDQMKEFKPPEPQPDPRIDSLNVQIASLDMTIQQLKADAEEQAKVTDELIAEMIDSHAKELGDIQKALETASSVLDDIPAPIDPETITQQVLAAIPKPEPGEKGEPGAPGKDAEPIDVDKVVDELKPTVLGALPMMIPEPIKGEPGDPGKDAEPVDVSAVVDTMLLTTRFHDMVKDTLTPMIPEPIKGEPGDPGEPGKDGNSVDPEEVTRQVASQVEVAFDEVWKHEFAAMIPDALDEDRVIKEITAKVKDDIPTSTDLKAMVDHALPSLIPDPIKGDPGPPGEPNDYQVQKAVEAMYPSIRKDILGGLPPIEHKGVYQPDQMYFPGDEVIRGDSSFRAKRETHEAPPHDDWQCIAKSRVGRRGPPGDPGKPGEPGEPGEKGTGVEDVVFEDGILAITLTNGDAHTIDLSDQMEKAILKALNHSEDE